MLLGAEVFTSIFQEGRWTGPGGTPSTINTWFGWVVFGKIQGSDVVEMANLTLEQDAFKHLTGSSHSYVAVLTATCDRGTDEWLRDDHIL